MITTSVKAHSEPVESNVKAKKIFRKDIDKKLLLCTNKYRKDNTAVVEYIQRSADFSSLNLPLQ